MLERIFHLKERGTTPRVEALAGVTTFLTMAYIIFVNPQVLSFFGDPAHASLALPFGATVTVTCVTAGILCIAMGVFANAPIALAAGMGLNAVVAYQLVLGDGLTFAGAMGIVVLEGVLVTLLVLSGLRRAVMDAIPLELKKAIAAGIGLFIAFIGFQQSGLVKRSDATLVTLGDVTAWPVFVAVIGLLGTLLLIERRVPGALMLGILGTTLLAVAVNALSGSRLFPPGVAVLPARLVSAPDFSTVGHVDFGAFGTMGVVKASLAVFALLLTDFFDTMGTVIAVCGKGGLLDAQGNPPGLQRILLVDSLGAVLGGAASSSSNTCYVESAAGVSQGGRTGLTAVVVGVLFLLATFLSPVASIVPKEATAPALILVGALMMSVVTEIDFTTARRGVPAFLVVLGIPVTYSISSGIGFGFVSYSAAHLLSGHGREVHVVLHLVAFAFLVDFMHPLLVALLAR